MPKKLYRAVQPHFHIYCEGETEKKYIECYLKKKYFGIPKQVKINVVAPDKMIHKANLDKKQKVKNDEFWLAFDNDNRDKNSIKSIFQLAESNEYNIAYSSICFEIWILLHYRYRSPNVNNCDEVISIIKSSFNDKYDKNDEEACTLIYSKIDCAKSNSEKLYRQNVRDHGQLKHYEYDVFTNFGDLLAALDEFIEDKTTYSR